ncbi:MAG: RNA polymerase sigma factor [Pirellulaceae bacterium]|nr:MAG: RNA polymerase sigma factor [Pirellulaceae bacterium]
MNSGPPGARREPDANRATSDNLPVSDEVPLAAEAAERNIATLNHQLRPMLVRLAWALCRDWSTAEDTVQEAFGLLAQRWGEIPAANRRGWLVRTVQLIARNQARRNTKFRGAALDEACWIAPPEGDPQQQIMRAEQVEVVREALGRLPPEQQEVVRWRIDEGMTFQEIADRQQVPLGTVLSRMRLAMERLRKGLM